MPEGETFFNPYRFVTLPNRPVERRPPEYHHRLSGQSGRAVCEVTTLTPLTISRGGSTGAFIQREKAPGQSAEPYVPATSLKGLIRSLMEVLGAAAVPFDKARLIDTHHQPRQAVAGEGTNWELDAVARTFGFIREGSQDCFAGLVRFHDGFLKSPPEVRPDRWPTETILGTGPKPDHRPFYPVGQPKRKVYHHQPEKTHLTPPPAGTKASQTTDRQTAPPGTQFECTVDFQNLQEDEIAWLLYALDLEPEVTVQLSKQALPAGASGPMQLTGPMCHKLGGGKAAGGGSVRIAITQLTLFDPQDRYRHRQTAPAPLTGSALETLLQQQRQRVHALTDRTTLAELQALMIYDPQDPRAREMHYPLQTWFSDNPHTKLKPTT